MENFEIYSFDVFETLVTRRTATPRGIFVLMEEVLKRDEKYSFLPEYVRDNFYNLRIAIEKFLYRYNQSNTGNLEITLDDIYSQFALNYGITDEGAGLLKELEIETEYDNALPISENIDLIKDLLNRGKKVILISDMYLSGEVIRKILAKFDIVFKYLKIFSSSDVKKRKSNSQIYKYLKEEENISDYKKWLHTGDNVKSDIEQAQKLGIQTKLFEYPQLEPYEKKLIEKYENDKYIQLSIGSSRNARILNKSLEYKLGCSLSAPVIMPYLLWLFKSCLKQGIKRLYFIARDGYLLKEAFDLIVKKYDADIETHYVYGSRIVWQMPSLTFTFNRNIESIIWQYGFNIDNMSKILDIDKDILLKYIPESFRNRILNFKDRTRVAKLLCSNKEFVSYVKNKNRAAGERALGYLKQEIDVSDENFAFVDLGGSGITQSCVASIMSNFYNKNIKSFYFRNGFNKKDLAGLESRYFLFKLEPCAFIEVLYRAPHGQTKDYIYDTEIKKFKPVLEESSCNKISYNEFLSGVNEFTKNYLELWDGSISNNLTYLYMDYLENDIDIETLDFLGDIKFSFIGSETSAIAPRVGLLKALAYLFGAELNTCIYKWSYQRSGKLVRLLLRFRKKLWRKV